MSSARRSSKKVKKTVIKTPYVEGTTLSIPQHYINVQDIPKILPPNGQIPKSTSLFFEEIPFSESRIKRKSSSLGKSESTANLEDFIQFKSEILRHRRLKGNTSTEFLQNFFQTESKETRIINWPNNKKITLRFIDNQLAIFTNDDINIAEVNVPLLTLEMNNNGLQLKQVNACEHWNQNDIKDLVNLFNLIYDTTVTYNETTNDYKEQIIIQDEDNEEEIKEEYEEGVDGKEEEKLATNKLDWLKLKEFQDCYIQNKDRLDMLPYFITYHTTRVDKAMRTTLVDENGEATTKEEPANVFWISLDNKKLNQNQVLSLKVCISSTGFEAEPKKDNYYSYLFSENSFLGTEFPEYKLKELEYFHVKVYEHVLTTPDNKVDKEAENEKEILDFWFDPSATFGELRDLNKGDFITGTVTMHIFLKELNHLFRVGDIYTCDSTREKGELSERHPDQIVFRVLMSIAEEETYYEGFGFEPVTCKDTEQGWPQEENLSKEKIDLNAEQYKDDRKKLGSISLLDLFDYFETEDNAEIKMNKTKRHLTLQKLCKKIYPNLKFNGKEEADQQMDVPSFHDLAKTIYDEFKACRKASLADPKSTKLKQKLTKAKKELTNLYSLAVLPEKYLYESFIDNPEAQTKVPKPFHKLLSTVVHSRFFKLATEYSKSAPEPKTKRVKARI